MHSLHWPRGGQVLVAFDQARRGTLCRAVSWAPWPPTA